MPLTRCSTDGKPGWKYGDTGTCYAYTAGDSASEAAAKQKAVKQAVAIGGGTAPRDLADDADDATVDALVELADVAGVEACTMGGNSGFRGKGGPQSACHLHDGTPEGKRSAMRKAMKDIGKATAPASYAELETEDLIGVPLMAAGGPYFGQGSPPEGDFFNDDHLNDIAAQTRAVADEVRIPIKLGHGRTQKLLKNSGLFNDEMPAAGWVNATNMRVAGGQLLGDLQRVPKKVAQLIKTGAFRTRSVELSRVTSQRQGGKKFENVITGLALLGAKAPAIRTLDDIIALYAESDEAHTPRFDDGTEATPLMVFSTTVQLSDAPADTSSMTTEAQNAAPDLSDEQIVSLAGTFGISEDDPAKRRAAVLDKFKQHTPTAETVEGGDTTPPPTPAPAPTTPPASDATPVPAPAANATPTVSMSEDEKSKLVEDAALGRKAYEEARNARISATLNTAAGQGRISVADIPKWRGFMERDYDFAVDQLAAQRPQQALLATFGADDNGDTNANKTEEAFYAAYAAQTGVPRRTVQTGGSA